MPVDIPTAFPARLMLISPWILGQTGWPGALIPAGAALCVSPWDLPFPSAPPSKLLPSPQNNSVSPSESLRASEKHRSSTDYSMDSKKRKAEEKDSMSRYVSDSDAAEAAGTPAGVESGIWGGTIQV